MQPLVSEVNRSSPARGCELRRSDAAPSPLQCERDLRVVPAIDALPDATTLPAGDEAQRRLAAIVESSDDAIISKDMNGTITSWNRAAERLYGYSAAEIVGRPIAVLIPADHTDDFPTIMERLRRGERIEHYETVRVARDGRRIDVSLTISPIRDASGRIVGASKIARDISERKRMEAQLREADRRKDEFLAVLGHELRNPLGAIRNVTQVLLLMTEDDVRYRELSLLLERQVGHMARLLDDLLDVGRIVQGKIRFVHGEVDVAAVVRQAIETTQPLLDAKRHRLRVDAPAAALRVYGDAARLAQAVSNLLNNAAKYTPAGGEIGVSVRTTAEALTIAVRDNGIGIAPESQGRIFDFFFQGESATAQKPDGLGIGLALVRTIVEHHGGAVRVHSDGPGTGSEFVVTLPRAEEVRAEPLVADAGESERARARILLVDDNRDALSALALLLRQRGHTVYTAAAGDRAVELATSLAPELVVLDIAMAGMDGYEVMRRMRTEGFTGRIVALTGYGSDEERNRALAAGFEAHFAKPVDPAAIERLLPPPTSAGSGERSSG